MPLAPTRTLKILAATLLVGLALWRPAPGLAQERTLTMRIPAEIVSLDPAFWQNASDLWVMEAVLPKLVIYKPGDRWEWELHAAEEIEQVDDRTIAFRLREGIQWTGGHGELTAEDVKYSFERYLDEDLASPIAGNFELLDRVEVTGKYTGLIHWTEPFAGVWGMVLPYASGHLVSKAAVEAREDKRYAIDIPATAGPYMIESHTPKQRMVLVANPDWPGPDPDFDRIVMLPMTDAKAAENAMLSGELDWAIISPSAVPSMQQAMPEALALEVKPNLNYFWLGLNMTHPKLEDPRVREAIQKAIDVEMVIEGAFFGVAVPSTGLAAPGLPGHVEKPDRDRDVEGARALLAEAGVSGLSLDLEVVADTDRVTAAQVIQANLAEVGIDVVINQHEAGAFWSLGDEKGADLQLQLKEFSPPPDMSWSTQWFLPEQAGIWNWEYFDSAEFVARHEAALKEMDPAERDRILREAQAAMDASHAFVWIAHPGRPVLYDAAKLEPAMLPNGIPRLELFKAR